VGGGALLRQKQKKQKIILNILNFGENYAIVRQFHAKL